jgi:uncharacterized protein (DUF58 family)
MLTDEQVEEMMQRVRKLELKARRLVRESFSGEYLSSFRGQGIDFDDFREYQHGDEVRFIDWNVTARMNQTFVRKFHEERELNVVIAVDVSGSVDYGSVTWSKRETATEAAAVLGFSAINNGDKIGLLVFAEEPLLFIPPAKGGRHLLRLIREILVARPKARGTSVDAACDLLVRTLRRKSLVCLISDFQSQPLDRALGKLSFKHDTIALRVGDPLENELPDAGPVVMIDPESDLELMVDTRTEHLRTGYADRMRQQRDGVDALFRKHGIDWADLHTSGDTLAELHRLLRRRARKRVR